MVAVDYYETNMDSVVVSKYHGRRKNTTQHLTSMLSLNKNINDQIEHGNIADNRALAKKYIQKLYRKPIRNMMFVSCKINGKKVKALVDMQ